MKFKTLFFLIFIVGLSSYGQGLIQKYPAVKLESEKIDNYNTLKIISIKNEDFLGNMSHGGGELKAYYNEDHKVKKIEVTIYKSYGIQEYLFFLKDQNPFLIIEKFNQFVYDTETNSFDYSEFDGRFQGTYIFKNKKLIDEISLGHNRFENGEIDAEKIFLSEFENYFKLITTQMQKNK